MSSMFKKKGGLAFKPKVPVGKTRPAAPARSSQPPKPVASQIAPEPVPEEPSQDLRESSTTEQVSEDAPSKAQETPSETPAIDRATPPSSQEVRETSAQAELPKDIETETAADVTRATHDEDDLPSIEAISTAVARARTEIEPTPAPDTEPAESTRITSTVPEPSEDSPPSTADPSSAAPIAAKAKPRAKRAAAPRKRKATEEPTDETAAAKRPTRKGTKKAEAIAEDGDEATEEPEPATRRPRKRRAREISGEASGDERSTPNTRARKARSVTPEDAETQTVDLQQIKMSDLTRDLRIGKKFSRHDELRERERQKKIKAKLQKEGVEVEDEEENGAQTPNGESNKGRNGDSSNPTDGQSASGPQFRIVDGQIVLDQTSLVMDRHARAAAEQEDMEIIEENDFSRQITSNTYMSTSKLRKGNNWSAHDTELFYRGLSMFGTDFEMISKMFKNKVRREVKLKFNREERHNPKLIDAALIGEKSVKMDIDEYTKLTSSTFESVESIEAEQRKVEEDYEAERQRLADEQAEAMRKKREALFADDKGGEDKDGDGGQQGKKKKKKNKKQHAQDTGLYGDEEIALD